MRDAVSSGGVARPPAGTVAAAATGRGRSPGAPKRASRSPTLPLLAGVLFLLNLAGARYYAEPLAQRVRDPLHVWLRPSGYIGQTAGLLSLALFLFMWLYPLRKRVRWLAFTGRLNRWLDVHIAAGLLLPVLGGVHAAWRFHGLIGLGYGAMLLVSLSGIVGRYLYTHIPRGRSGIELSLEEVEAQRRQLVESIALASGIAPAEVDAALARAGRVASTGGVAATLVALLSQDLVRWRVGRELRRRLIAQRSGQPLDTRAVKQVLRLCRRQIALTQQMRMLDATQRVFRFWHVAHLPVAVTALLAVLIHVAVVTAVGMTWFW